MGEAVLSPKLHSLKSLPLEHQNITAIGSRAHRELVKLIQGGKRGPLTQ